MNTKTQHREHIAHAYTLAEDLRRFFVETEGATTGEAFAGIAIFCAEVLAQMPAKERLDYGRTLMGAMFGGPQMTTAEVEQMMTSTLKGRHSDAERGLCK